MALYKLYNQNHILLSVFLNSFQLGISLWIWF